MPGIIKGGAWSEAGSAPLTALNLEDVTQRAEEHLSRAREQAAQIIAVARQTAEQQAAQIAQRARQQGREDALREARQELTAALDQQLATLIPALQQAVQEIHDAKAAWLQHWERQTLHLACAIAKRIIRRELRQQPEITLDLLREALELMLGQGRITVQLSPQDYESLRERTQELTDRFHGLASATIVADPEVTPGGCRVLTEFGVIDQRVESQLARIEEELR